MMPFWNADRLCQFSTTVPKPPNMNGFSVSSCKGVFVGASRSQINGSTKNTRKTSATTIARARPSQPRGDPAVRRSRVSTALVALKETSTEDEERGQSECDHEKDEGDRRRAVEVVLSERVQVGELVQ